MQGCFIGAETLSKLSNLDAVKQQLWGLQLAAPAAPGDLIMGLLPSCAITMQKSYRKVSCCRAQVSFTTAGSCQAECLAFLSLRHSISSKSD